MATDTAKGRWRGRGGSKLLRTLRQQEVVAEMKSTGGAIAAGRVLGYVPGSQVDDDALTHFGG